MHDGMQYDSIQRQGHEPLKVSNSAVFNRVPMPHGKSWISFCKISRPWKVLEMGLVLESRGNFSERSWKVLKFSRQ